MVDTYGKVKVSWLCNPSVTCGVEFGCREDICEGIVISVYRIVWSIVEVISEMVTDGPRH